MSRKTYISRNYIYSNILFSTYIEITKIAHAQRMTSQTLVYRVIILQAGKKCGQEQELTGTREKYFTKCKDNFTGEISGV
jgi:hypothetical protein